MTIDNKVPVLGFTINTGGLPYFEVLLTTDRALFDPGATGRRTPGTFYSSRQDGGLTPALDTASVYLVPPTVLGGFAAAQPPPTAIYYTAIAYTDASGSNPTFAQPLDTLVAGAPSVMVASDFRGQTLSRVLGISPHMLQRVGATGRPGGDEWANSAGSAYSQADETDPESDRAGGEDGYGLPEPEPGPAQQSYEPERSYGVMEAGYAALPPLPPAPLYSNGTSNSGHSQPSYSTSYDDDFQYSDGFEDDYGDIDALSADDPALAAAAGWDDEVLSYPGAERHMPTMLQDDEDSMYGEDGEYPQDDY
jgi:hypothetical protein